MPENKFIIDPNTGLLTINKPTETLQVGAFGGSSMSGQISPEELETYTSRNLNYELTDEPYANEIARNQRQTAWDKAGNMFGRGIGKAALTVPESLGYLLDVPEVLGITREYDNIFSEMARQGKEGLEDIMPEYSRELPGSESFNPGSFEWWMRNGDSIIESLGYMIPGGAVGKAVGLGAKGLGASLATQEIAGGISAAVAMNYTESMQVAGQTYKDLLSKGVSKEIASQEAADIISQGKANLIFEIPQYMSLMRGFKTSRKLANMDSKLLNSKALQLGYQGLNEAGEEWGLDFIAKENERDALIRAGQLQDDGSSGTGRFWDYVTSDEGLTAGLLGALGGVAFEGFAQLSTLGKDRKAESLGKSLVASNKGNLEDLLRKTGNLYEESVKAVKANDETSFNKAQRQAFNELALYNAQAGTYEQFTSTLDKLAQTQGQTTEETLEIQKKAAEWKNAAYEIEEMYDKVANTFPTESLQKTGLNLLFKEKDSFKAVQDANNKITEVYTKSTLSPLKQPINRLFNRYKALKRHYESVKDNPNVNPVYKEKLQNQLKQTKEEGKKALDLFNQQNTIDSDFTQSQYWEQPETGNKFKEADFEDNTIDSDIIKQEQNIFDNSFEAQESKKAYKQLSNPKIQEAIIEQEKEIAVETAKEAEKVAIKALKEEFDALIQSPETNLPRLEEINTQLKGTELGKQINLALNKVKSDIKKKTEVKKETPKTTEVFGEVDDIEEISTTLTETTTGVVESNTTVATSDSSDIKKVNDEADEYKVRKKKETITGAYLDLEYIESADGTLIVSLRDENGNVVPAERMLEDFIDYSKYPNGTEIIYVIDRDWQQKNNIPDTAWWNLPISAQINGKTVFYIPAFSSEPIGDTIDSNIQKRFAENAWTQVQKDLTAQRKDLSVRLLANDSVTGQIVEYGTGAIDNYTKEPDLVINRLGNNTSLYKDIQFAVVDKGKPQFKYLTNPTQEFYVDNNLVTSEYFSKLPNGSVVVLLPSYARNSSNQNELVPRAIDRVTLSNEDVDIVVHLIETYGKYGKEEVQKEIGLTLPEGTKNATEYLINNFVYNGKSKGAYFDVELQKGERVVKVKDPSGAVTRTIPVKDRDVLIGYLSGLRYNIHSNPYFKLDFENGKITKVESLDSRTVIAQRTKTNIDNTTFSIINGAENKMQIFRQPAIYYSINKKQDTKKAPVQKKATKKEVKETAKDTTKISLPKSKYNAITKANDKTIVTVLRQELDTDTFREFNKAFKASGLTSRSEFAKTYFQIDETIKPENNPSTDALKSTLSSLDSTKLQRLNEIEKSTNPYKSLVEDIINFPDKDLRNIIFKLIPILGDVKIEFITEVSSNLAKVVYADNKIIINKYAVARNPRALEYVVGHEMMHLATLKGLTTDSTFNKNITKLYNFVKSKLGDSYALSNVREFVSEGYNNPEFKQQLKSLEYEGSNVFEKFWQFIKGLFGLRDNAFTLLDKYTNQYLMDYVKDIEGNIVEDKLISDYQVEGMSLQESYNMVQSMTGLAQDIFRESSVNIPVLELHKQVYERLKQRFEEAKDLEEFDDNINLQYEAILFNNGDNDTFKKLLARFDKNLVYLQNILSKEFEEADIDLEFDEEYSTQGSENYGREAFQDNPKDKASIRLKRFLAFIPDSIYNSDKTDYTTLQNEFGLSQYVPYDVMYNTIAQFTANTTFQSMKSKLEKIATKNANVKVVLDRLEQLRLSAKKEDNLLYNEFWSNFKKQHATFATTIYQNKKSDNNNKVIYSNRNSATLTLIDRWYTEFKNTYTNSGLVEVKGSAYVVNKTKANELREQFNKATQIKNKLEQGLAYSEILAQAGITVEESAVELLLESPELFNFKNSDEALTRFKEAVSRITLNLTKDTDKENIEESKDNPFTREIKEAGESTSLEFLAQMQIYVDSNLLSSMFRNEEGKNIYTIFNNTIVSDIMTYLRDKDARKTIIENWSKSAFHKDNYLIKQIINGDLRPEDLELVLMSTMAQDKKSNSGKPYPKLTEQERQVTKLINFLSKSLFQFPTLSDKPTIPFFKMKKIDVSVKDGKLNDSALEAVYSIFQQEANRIIKANNDFKTVEQKNLLIPNYHVKKDSHANSNSQKFMFLPQLDSFKVTIEGVEYKLRDVLISQQEITSDVELQVKEELNRIVLEYIQQTKNYYDSLSISKNGKILEKFANDKDGTLIEEFTVSNLLATASIYSIFNNDPAYSKDIDDVSKRGAMLTAPGQDLFNEDNGQFKSLIINDVYFKTKNNKNLLDYFTKHFKSEEKAKEFLEPYTKLNGTDAQAYVSVKFYEDIMKKLGREFDVYQPLKLVYTQDVWDDRTQNYIRKYIKFSAFPLFEDLTKGTQLDEFRLDMESKGVDFVAFESASKLGTQGLQQAYDGNILTINPDNVLPLPLSGMRLQQEVPYDEDKNAINVVSQARKLLFGDLLGIEGYEDIVGLKDKFDTLHEANVLESFEELKKELGLTIEDGRYYISNIEGLRDLLTEEILSRSNNENLLEALELKVDVNTLLKGFKIPLYFSPNSQSFESLLFSLISNGVIKQKHTGKSFVQGSEFGFFDVTSKIPKDIEDKIEWVRDNSKSLDTFQVGKDNKLEPEGILLPNIYRNILKEGQEVPADLLKVFGFRIPNQGHNSMASLKIQGFLPAEAGDLVIVTPEMLKRMGSDFDVDKLYIYFYNIKSTKKKGLEKIEYFDKPEDIDKRWSLYEETILRSKEAKQLIKEEGLDIKSIRIEDPATDRIIKALFGTTGTIDNLLDILAAEDKAISYDEFKLLSIELQNSRKARENAILDIYFEVFSNPALLEKIMMPNDIKPLVDAVNAIVPQDKEVKNILTVKTQDDYFTANLGGKTGVGITSLWNTFFSQMQYYNVEIAGQGIMFKDVNGEVIRPKDEKGKYIEDNKLGLIKLTDIKGKINNSFISNILQIFQSAAVDNAKEQILDKAGLNTETLDVAQMIAMSGIDDLELIVAFLKQPYIEKYVDFSQRLRTRFDEFERGSYKDRAIKKALEALNSQLKDLGEETYTSFNEVSVAFSKAELKEFIDKEPTTKEEKVKFLQGQYQILSNFINYKDKADVLGKAIVAYNIDTKSVGKNYYDVKKAINKYQTYFIKDSESVSFTGLAEMGNNKFVKSLYEKGLKVAETAFNRSDILPFNSKMFRELYSSAAVFLDKKEEDLTAQDIKLLNKTALWYITSIEGNGIFDESIKVLRERLLTSTKENPSLAKRIKQLIDDGYNNWLVQRLTIDEDKITYYRNTIEKSEEILAVISFNQLLTDYPEIGKELIQYSYLTSGGNPTATGFSNIIPVTELNKLGFGEFYNSKFFTDMLEDKEFIDTFYTQYYQNNPTKAFNAEGLNTKKFTDKNVEFKSDKDLPKFMYLYITKKGEKAETLLFKKNPNFNPTDNVYYPLALLNEEYAANKELTSIYPANNKYASFPIQNTFEKKESLEDKVNDMKTPEDSNIIDNILTVSEEKVNEKKKECNG